jgi:dihydrofolate reductase
MRVFVLTSRPLPAGTPDDAGAAADVAGLVEQLRARGSDGDVHLVGGPRTIEAFCRQGALDSLEVVVLPLVLGDGIPLWPRGTAQPRLRLRHQPRVFPDGSAELSYSTA